MNVEPIALLDEEWVGYDSTTYYTGDDYEEHGEDCRECNDDEVAS